MGAVTVERVWRCGVCGLEEPVDTAELRNPRYGPRWHAGDHEPAVMRLVERETVYESAAVRQLLTNFEVSDWGLLEQAAEHYGKNRRRTAHRNPGADAVLARCVYPRLEALARACRSMRRYALRDTEHGGRIVGAFPDV